MTFKPGQSGNPKGRPPLGEVELIRQAINETSIEKKKSLWKHLIEQCYVDNTLLGHVAKKFMPDVSIIKSSDENGKDVPFSIVIKTVEKKD